jgi:hypothetical protein
MKSIKGTRRARTKGESLRSHYDLDYSKSHPNLFADRAKGDRLVVVLDPVVSRFFPSAEAVNDFLRAVIAAFEEKSAPKKKVAE